MKAITKANMQSMIEKVTWKPQRYTFIREGVVDGFEVDFTLQTAKMQIKVDIRKTGSCAPTEILGFYKHDWVEGLNSVFNAIDQKMSDSETCKEFMEVIG